MAATASFSGNRCDGDRSNRRRKRICGSGLGEIREQEQRNALAKLSVMNSLMDWNGLRILYKDNRPGEDEGISHQLVIYSFITAHIESEQQFPDECTYKQR